MDNSIESRYTWYSYYIPMIAFPLINFFISLCLGKYDVEFLYKVFKPLLSVAITLVVLVYTNDFHQELFYFYNGFEHADNEYTYGPVYALIAIWIVVLQIISIVLTFRKISIDSAKKYIWIPLSFFILGIVFSCIIVFTDLLVIDGVTIIHFHQFYSVLIVGFWESCIQIGMVVSNRNYDKLFEASATNTVIQNSDRKIVYSTKGFENDKIGKGRRIHRHSIAGGEVIWIDDISQLMEKRAQLSEVKEMLSQERELLSAEKRIQEKKVKLETRDRLYTNMSQRMEKKNQEIEDLIKSHMDDREKLARISVIGAYIKRWCNLSLLMNKDMILVKELDLSVRESLEYAELAGIKSYLDFRVPEDKLYEGKAVIEIYERFGNNLEKLVGKVAFLYVKIDETDKGLLLEMTVDDDEEPELRYESGGEYQ
ncbi:MAG: hypothetical protein K6E10_06835 [Eubacterium sp.]|nr:hypothetical protein [Eubacterium sp.]